VNARVIESLEKALYRVELATSGRPRVTAHLANEALLRVRPGDEVVVELSPYDDGRGRIVRRRD
jgi:translation initiation factor IF-1